VVVANFPHNTTGAALTVTEQAAVAALADEAGAYLVSDRVFGDLVYDSAHRVTDPALGASRALFLGTLSKAYGLSGLRVGWCFGPPDLLRRLMALRDHVTICLSPLVELVAQRVVEAADRLLDMKLAQARRNRELLGAWLREHVAAVEGVPALGGVTVFPRLRAHPSADRLCEDLLDRHGVLLLPGSCFGMPDHVRLGFGGRTDDLREGLRG
jgi:aspartate/methionine/tyrosine aminotransferase